MGSCDESIVIIQNAKGSKKSNQDNVFVIEEAIDKIDTEQFEAYYDTFANSEASSNLGVPLYQILWQKLAVPQQSSRIRLIHLIILYEMIDEKVKSLNANRIICNNIEEQYRPLIEDLAESNDISYEDELNNPALDNFLIFIRSMLFTLPYIFDQIVSIFLRHIDTSLTKAEVVISPPPAYFHIVESVLEQASFEYTVVIPSTTIGWLKNGRHKRNNLRKFSPTPINMFVSGRVFKSELKFLSVLAAEILFKRRLDASLIKIFEKEHGVSMPNTIRNELNYAYDAKLFRSLLQYYVTRECVEYVNSTALVVGTGSPLGRAMMAAGKIQKQYLYHIRHGIVTGYTPEPPFNSIEFIEGKMGLNYLKSRPYARDLSRFKLTGYQYLTQIYENYNNRKEVSDTIKVVIATQNYDKETRDEFISEVLEGLDLININAEIQIKPHPAEDASYYNRFETRSVTVVEGQLHKRLNKADLVITINSNVGLEGILCGAACICVNKWEPVIRNMPYAEQSSVPILGTSNQITSYFCEFDKRDVKKIYKNQIDSVQNNKNLLLDGLSSQRIINIINKNI